MNPKIKDYVGWAAFGALVIGAVLGIQYTSAYSRSIPPSASFSVSGEGRATVIPDIAEFSFGITTEGGKDIAAIQRENTQKANDAISFVKSQGVDSKDIKTRNYNIEPRYQYFSCPPVVYAQSVGVEIMPKPCPPSEIVGYIVRQTISVKVRDFAKLGDIVSGVTERGANNVSDLSFTVDDRTEVENEARAEAIAEAQRKARVLAKSGRFRIGRIISIQESGAVPPIYYTRALGMGGDTIAEKAPAPAIEPGSEEITQTITITYEIR